MYLGGDTGLAASLQDDHIMESPGVCIIGVTLNEEFDAENISDVVNDASIYLDPD